MTDGSVRRAHITESRVATRRLGRHLEHDERSRDFGATRADKIVSVFHDVYGVPLDQGDIGSCTAEALTGAGNAHPNIHEGQTVRDQDDAYFLYGEETKDEGQPWPPNDPGGTGLQVCKTAKRLGWITGYEHAFGLQHALEALTLRPVITGTNWYSSMDATDNNGLVVVTSDAELRGGHEYLADQIVAEHELVGFWNSWGPGYGQGGRFFLSYETWGRLLAEDGDVTVPIFA